MAVNRPRRTALHKPSFRDHIAKVNSANAGMEAMFGDLREAKGFDAPLPIVMKPKREIVNRSDPSELEAAVQTEVESVLATHPNVIFAIRQNTGAAKMIGRDGKEYPIWFYRWIRRPNPMTVTDFWGFIFTKGQPIRQCVPFALECKRRSWIYSDTEREKQQQEFIDSIIDCGGRGGFVTSADQALAILK